MRFHGSQRFKNWMIGERNGEFSTVVMYDRTLLWFCTGTGRDWLCDGDFRLNACRAASGG